MRVKYLVGKGINKKETYEKIGEFENARVIVNDEKLCLLLNDTHRYETGESTWIHYNELFEKGYTDLSKYKLSVLVKFINKKGEFYAAN